MPVSPISNPLAEHDQRILEKLEFHTGRHIPELFAVPEDGSAPLCQYSTTRWESNVPRINTLYLRGQKLAQIPSEIAELPGLTLLDLGNNPMISIPAEVWNLTNLRDLYLGGSHLGSLPPELGRLTNLEYLYLNGNSLSRLPPAIAYLV